MKIRNHVCFRTSEEKELLNYLKNNRIPFEEDAIISSVDILESDPHWKVISEFVQNKHLLCQHETVFSKDELLHSEWLTIRSQWRYGYPQPENDFAYETLTYSRDHYCKECAGGLVQMNSFRMKKVPKWGKRNFMELNWIGDELFLSDAGKTALEDACITGIFFRDVKDRKGIESFKGIHQLVIPTLLKNGIVEDCSGIREYSVCPCCNTKKYVTSGAGMLDFQEECFNNTPDIVKSAELFGSGQYASRVIIIRQKVYRTIIEKGLDRGLVFEPIRLLKRQ